MTKQFNIFGMFGGYNMYIYIYVCASPCSDRGNFMFALCFECNLQSQTHLLIVAATCCNSRWDAPGLCGREGLCGIRSSSSPVDQ